MYQVDMDLLPKGVDVLCTVVVVGTIVDELVAM
jgi:hypothetical protein